MDYDALAAQHGGATEAPDYETLAAQHGAAGYEGMPGPRGILNYIDTTLGNVPQDVMNIGQGAYTAATNPLQTLQNVSEAVANPAETLSGVARGVGRFLQSPLQTFQQAPVSTALNLSGAGAVTAPLRAIPYTLAEHAYPMARNAFAPKARAYMETLGAQTPEAINALAAARPGVTVPQALADVNAPQLQTFAQAAMKQVPQEARAVAQAQETARAARIGQIAGTESDLEAAKAARDAAAASNYKRAFAKVIPESKELTAILDRPSMEKAFGRAAQIAEEKGQSFRIGKTKPAETVPSSILDEYGNPILKITPAEIAKYPMQSLHHVKMALDDMIRDPKDFGIGATEVGAIKQTRKEFVSQLEKIPEYAKARSDYAAQSQPINKMQVAQQLQKALTEPVTEGATRGGMFARAVEEAPKTIKKATGQTFFDKLEDVFSPEEMKVVNDVRDEFRRSKLSKEQADLGKAATPSAEELASSKLGSISHLNLLNRVWTIANTVVKRSLGKIDEKLATEIGMQMLDPAEFKKALTAAQEYSKATEKGVENIRARKAAVKKTIIPPAISGAVTFGNVMAPENRNAMAR